MQSTCLGAGWCGEDAVFAGENEGDSEENAEGDD